MSFVLTKKLPTPMEIKELYPVSAELAALKAAKDQELIDIITGASDKFRVILSLIHIYTARSAHNNLSDSRIIKEFKICIKKPCNILR